MANAAKCAMPTCHRRRELSMYINYNYVGTMITPSGIHWEGRAKDMEEGKDGEPKTRNLEPV